MARLDEVLLQDQRPVVLVAHSLGCVLTAAWAGHSQHTAQVRGALLVAPPDLQRSDMPPQVAAWRPVPAQPLPFPVTLVFSSNDPYCSATRAAEFSTQWGATPWPAGACGHVNGESGLGDWPEGLALLAGWGVVLRSAL